MTKGFRGEADSSMAKHPGGTDGALDRVLRQAQPKKHVPAIFVHAGAGFHSHQNEHVHLEACVAAAEMGMRFLKAGATATETVEATLRVLEDKEITNAGYGSNLSIDGTVECDATIVDHLGRSGACGAVPNIRNPISLAKLILDRSAKPLSLRRVPPNALVGEGARQFAEEHGMVSIVNESLVSKTSRDRFLRWQEDLHRAETRVKEGSPKASGFRAGMGCAPCQFDTATPPNPCATFPRDHTAAIVMGPWNEGQTDSPSAGTPSTESPVAADSSISLTPPRPPWVASSSQSLKATPPPVTSAIHIQGSAPTLQSSTNAESNGSNRKRQSYRDKVLKSGRKPDEKQRDVSGNSPLRNIHTTSDGSGFYSAINHGHKRPIDTTDGHDLEQEHGKDRRHHWPRNAMDDHITDTIGAIAIDENGLIAAGSSSGGIGMKHRGRLGPAALVGISTAVVPAADEDGSGTTVAAVTSGTGEHMATTMASQRCAERLYHGNRSGTRGEIVEEDDDDLVMESFILNDFMGHPGVKNCASVGAIGVMAVKKSRGGYYLYFAHNTDSFALASFGGSEKQPSCVMSRLPEGAKICRGARKVRIA